MLDQHQKQDPKEILWATFQAFHALRRAWDEGLRRLFLAIAGLTSAAVFLWALISQDVERPSWRPITLEDVAFWLVISVFLAAIAGGVVLSLLRGGLRLVQWVRAGFIPPDS